MRKFYIEEIIPKKSPVLVHYQEGSTKGTFAYTHMHKYIEMLYCTDGNFTIILDEQTHTFEKGDFVVINSMENHTIYSTDEKGGGYICLRVLPEILYFPNELDFDYKYITPFLLSSFQRKRVFKRDEIKNSGIKEEMENVLSEDTNRNFGYELALKSHASKIMLWVVRNCGISEQNNASFEVIEKIRNLLFYLEQNCHEDINARDGAIFCEMSYSYFSRIFKRLMKRSFSEHLNYIRVLKAETLLVTTDKSVTEIALECGFSTSSYFIKNFKKVKNITPKQMRNKFSL